MTDLHTGCSLSQVDSFFTFCAMGLFTLVSVYFQLGGKVDSSYAELFFTLR